MRPIRTLKRTCQSLVEADRRLSQRCANVAPRRPVRRIATILQASVMCVARSLRRSGRVIGGRIKLVEVVWRRCVKLVEGIWRRGWNGACRRIELRQDSRVRYRRRSAARAIQLRQYCGVGDKFRLPRPRAWRRIHHKAWRRRWYAVGRRPHGCAACAGFVHHEAGRRGRHGSLRPA
jgi:hypothetical protein